MFTLIVLSKGGFEDSSIIHFIANWSVSAFSNVFPMFVQCLSNVSPMSKRCPTLFNAQRNFSQPKSKWPQ